jgi:hypothetical protein
MKRLNVHIDRLTIEGKTMAEGRLIVEAIERHLTVLANSPTALVTSPMNRVNACTIPAAAGVDAIGSNIANQVFQKLGGRRNV